MCYTPIAPLGLCVGQDAPPTGIRCNPSIEIHISTSSYVMITGWETCDYERLLILENRPTEPSNMGYVNPLLGWLFLLARMILRFLPLDALSSSHHLYEVDRRPPFQR